MQLRSLLWLFLEKLGSQEVSHITTVTCPLPPVIEYAASEPAVTDTAPAPVCEYVAPDASRAPVIEYGPRPPAAARAAPTPVCARAVVHEATAPVIKYVDPAPAFILEAPTAVIEHVAAPAITYAAPATVIEHAAAPAVTCTAPPPLIEYVRPAPAVPYTASVPVIEHVAPAPPVILQSAAPVIEHVAAGHKSPKRAKKSLRSKRPHHHDDDDLLHSEATALADHERAVMREEIRIMLAADPHRCPSRHRMCVKSTRTVPGVSPGMVHDMRTGRLLSLFPQCVEVICCGSCGHLRWHLCRDTFHQQERWTEADLFQRS